MKINLKFPFIIAASAAVILLILFGLRPTKVNRSNAGSMDAVVINVSEGGLKDIVVSLSGVRGIYYISHGKERGLNADSLAKRLLNKRVHLLYAKPGFLSRLSPATDTRQIVELKLADKVIFSDLR